MNLSNEPLESLLRDFLSKISTKKKNGLNEKQLIAFAFKMEKFPTDVNIDSFLKSETPSFYISRKSPDFKLLALGKSMEILIDSGEKFDELKEKVSEISKNFISNFERVGLEQMPLFVGGKEFYNKDSSEIWKDFYGSFWFVPKLMFTNYKGISAGLFTFQNTSEEIQHEEIVESFLSELKRIDFARQSNPWRTTARLVEKEGLSDKEQWNEMVNKTLDAIKKNEVKKVVISRKIELEVSQELDFNFITRKLENDYPDCYTFVFHSGDSFFFGASPERLAKFSNGRVYTNAIAGSAPRGKNKEEDVAIGQQLLSDSKNLAEQKFVVDHIMNSLLDFVDEISIQEKPHLMRLANIQHLHSEITGTLKEGSSMLSIIERLHPTPAVCGHPRDKALDLIKKLEGYPRGMYAGIIGWFNFNGDGEFVVTIRSALSKKNKLIAFAGCGIVEGSHPQAEFRETQLKLKPILSLFNYENKD